MDTLTISRAIFLIFIVVLSVYFLFLNKSFSTKEHFANMDSAKVDSIVKDTYIKEFKREPTEKELIFFQAYAIEKDPNDEQLVQAIKSSADIVNKAYSPDSSPIFQEAYGTEDEVTEIFNSILNRLPDDNELSTFSKLLKEDRDFTLEKLKQLLYGSEEFNRLQKTQSNQVYGNLIGGVTDRQITLIVMTNYKKIVGKDTANIDSDELKFLKKKLVEFNLDEAVFNKFLESYVKNQPFNQQIQASEKVKKLIQQEQMHAQSNDDQAKYDRIKKELYTELVADLAKNSLVQQEQASFTDPKGVEHAVLPNKQVIEVLLKTDNMTKERDVGYLDNPQSMANLVNERNKSLIKDTCVRNRKYLGLDEDMVLDPSLKWKLPQRHPPVCVGGKNDFKPLMDQTALIGTLLPDAKNTKVGSVVDFYPPR